MSVRAGSHRLSEEHRRYHQPGAMRDGDRKRPQRQLRRRYPRKRPGVTLLEQPKDPKADDEKRKKKDAEKRKNEQQKRKDAEKENDKEKSDS